MLPRRPLPLGQLQLPAAGSSLARLSGVEGFARAVPSGVIPLIALDALGSKSAVSYSYLGGAAMALAMTLNLGTLERLIARRRVVTLAFVMLIGASILFASANGITFAFAIGLQSAAASAFSVGLSLYVMDYIVKRELVRVESKRMVFNGLSWVVGPLVGVWLYERSGRSLPFLVAAVAAIVALSYFWRLRLANNPVLVHPATTPSSPFRTIPRFFRQRYLRVAYAITLIRSTFWAAFFVYGPIYAIEAGLARWWGGAMVSLVAALLFFGPLVRRLAERITTRAMMQIGFITIAVGMLGLFGLGAPRPIGVVCWLFAAIGAAILDVLGNIPFMRTVKPRERIPMTTVFSTWRDASLILSPALAAITLLVAPFRFFYLVLAALSLWVAVLTTYLPRRL